MNLKTVQGTVWVQFCQRMLLLILETEYIMADYKETYENNHRVKSF
jgi:hypothetical protein